MKKIISQILSSFQVIKETDIEIKIREHHESMDHVESLVIPPRLSLFYDLEDEEGRALFRRDAKEVILKSIDQILQDPLSVSWYKKDDVHFYDKKIEAYQTYLFDDVFDKVEDIRKGGAEKTLEPLLDELNEVLRRHNLFLYPEYITSGANYSELGSIAYSNCRLCFSITTHRSSGK